MEVANDSCQGSQRGKDWRRHQCYRVWTCFLHLCVCRNYSLCCAYAVLCEAVISQTGASSLNKCPLVSQMFVHNAHSREHGVGCGHSGGMKLPSVHRISLDWNISNNWIWGIDMRFATHTHGANSHQPQLYFRFVLIDKCWHVNKVNYGNMLTENTITTNDTRCSPNIKRIIKSYNCLHMMTYKCLSDGWKTFRLLYKA